jgi:hypothetical protein
MLLLFVAFVCMDTGSFAPTTTTLEKPERIERLEILTNWMKRAFEPLGKRAFEPFGKRAFEPLGKRAFEPFGKRAFEPLGKRAFEPLGKRAFEHLEENDSSELGTGNKNEEETIEIEDRIPRASEFDEWKPNAEKSSSGFDLDIIISNLAKRGFEPLGRRKRNV